MVDYVKEIETLLETLKKFEQGLNEKFNIRENQLQAKMDEAKGVVPEIKNMIAEARQVAERLDTIHRLTNEVSEKTEKVSVALNELKEWTSLVKRQQADAEVDSKKLAEKIRKYLLQTSQTAVNELKTANESANVTHKRNIEDLKEWTAVITRKETDAEAQLGHAFENAQTKLLQISKGTLSEFKKADEISKETHRKNVEDLNLETRRVRKLLLVLRRRMAWYMATGIGGMAVGIVSLILHFTLP